MEFMTANEKHRPVVKWWLGDLRKDDLFRGVNVWQFQIGALHSSLSDFLEDLSEDEIERSAQFHFRNDQARFIIVRGILRSILGNYHGMQPRELRFSYNPYGKPELSLAQDAGPLHFNVSHSGDLAIIALSRKSAVGVDIEQKRPETDIDIISSRFFSHQEILSLNSLDPETREEMFYKYWTRKEAFVKALGKGVSFPLEHCDVSLLNGDGAIPVTVEGKGSKWHGIDLPTDFGYTAALVTEGTCEGINFSKF